jgi:hypothetical protein
MPKKSKCKSQQYRVVWEIDIVAESAKAAAEKALEIHRDPESLATVFDCWSELGKGKRVDLTEGSSTPL